MKVIVVLVVAACYILGLFCGQTEALNCYTCIATDDCVDPFKTTSTSKNCAMCGKFKGEQNGVQGVIRSCESTDLGLSEGCTSETKNGVRGDVCKCKSDLCNVSTHATMTTALLVLQPALLMYFKTSLL